MRYINLRSTYLLTYLLCSLIFIFSSITFTFSALSFFLVLNFTAWTACQMMRHKVNDQSQEFLEF